MAFTQLKPPHTYGRTPPSLFNLQASPDADLRAFLYALCPEAVGCPAEGFTLVDHCYVYDGMFVLMPDLEWMADTVVDYGIADAVKPVLQDVIRGRHHGPLAPSPLKTVVIAKSGADNHGHVLTDILPKLVNVARSGLPGVRLLLPAGMQRYGGLIAGLLDRAGMPAELEFHTPATLKEAREVYVFSPVGRHNARKSTTFLELADRLRGLYGIRHQPHRRLFVRRGPGDIRGLRDAEAVEAVFARHGFEAVYPPDLSVEGQISLFATASHVAGPMGAGLANIGWAAPGCEVLMIDPGIGDFYFWDFSCLMEQRFHWLFAAPYRGYTPALGQDSFAIDRELLGGTLRSLYG